MIDEKGSFFAAVLTVSLTSAAILFSLTAETIEKAMRKLFDIGEERETRIWNKYMSNTYEHLSKKENTVQDAGLYQGQVRRDITRQLGKSTSFGSDKEN